MRNPFKVGAVSSYRYPITKLITSGVIIAVMCSRKDICAELGITIEPIVNVLCGIIGCAAILCVYTSIAEIAFYREAKHAQQPQKTKVETYSYSVETLCKFVEKNDIIEIVFLSGNCHVTIGSSSESDRASGTFYNKEYYIDNHIFHSFGEFHQSMTNTFPSDGFVQVVTIDGISPKYYS